jgi:Protein of unknown function (DUF3467)
MSQQKQFEVVTESPIQSIYANSTRLMFGIYDFRVVFSETMMRSDFTFVQLDRISVVMSPQHMKRLVKTLNDKLIEYEAKFAPIPEDPSEQHESGSDAESEPNQSAPPD